MHWDPTTAKIGLQQLRRLRGEIAALEAVLVGVVKTEMGHDTKAALARGFGMSNAEARKAEEVADIVGRVPGAGRRTGDLPTLEGEQVKSTLNAACDAAWRAAHPERAETLGAHDDEPREQRLADALVAVMNGTATGGSTRTAMVVTMQAETLECKILGVGPIPTEDALTLVDDPRTDIYAAVQATDGGIMKFGRSRRLASPLQKLALALRDGGFCTKPGCCAPWHRCDADHIVEWDDGGATDIENLRHLCGCDCHPHRHETGAEMTRQRDGTWTVDNEVFPPWPPPTPAVNAPDLESQHRLRQLCFAVGRPDPYSYATPESSPVP